MPKTVARTDVAALDRGGGGSETQTNVLIPSSSTLAWSGALRLDLGVEEDVRLLLESTPDWTVNSVALNTMVSKKTRGVCYMRD